MSFRFVRLCNNRNIYLYLPCIHGTLLISINDLFFLGNLIPFPFLFFSIPPPPLFFFSPTYSFPVSSFLPLGLRRSRKYLLGLRYLLMLCQCIYMD
ncbi:hypothetical protein F5X96DRAFT_515645 [Biscogniauxia mediterranea]|nr:hypothetical protein F5X96DRAFT_515645 [Biscogniauxia mediterranea]